MSAAIRIAILFLTIAATSTAAADGERVIRLDFDDVSSRVVFEAMSKILDDATIIGTPPNCRVTIQTAPMPMDQLMAKLNQAFGIAFVKTTEGFQIFVPKDTERLCTVVFLGG